jgi:hypothetical protein
MSALFSDHAETDREVAIKTIASEATIFSYSTVLEGGGFSSRQIGIFGYGADKLITAAICQDR